MRRDCGYRLIGYDVDVLPVIQADDYEIAGLISELILIERSGAVWICW